MRRSLSFAIVLSVIMYFVPSAPVDASPPGHAINVTIGGDSIDMDAIMRLFRGIFEAAGANTGEAWVASLEGKPILRRAKIVDTVDTPPASMPTGYRYFYYAGRDPSSEREIIRQSTETKKMCVGAPGCIADDEFIAAYALAALDAYYIDGEPWRSLYKSASDAASRQALGKEIANAVTEASNQESERGAQGASGIRQKITVGMSRDDAYAIVRSLDLVAYNSAFNPGVPTTSPAGYKGCDFSNDKPAAWPYHGESLPKRSGECAIMGTADPGPFPSAYIDLPGGFTIACGSSARATLDFDTSDRIRKVTIEKPEWTCM